MSLLLATSVLLAGLLALPRPAAITELPLPRVHWQRVGARHLAAVRALAETGRHPLSYKLRSVGELFRRLGAAEARRDGAEAEALRRELVWAAREGLQSEGASELERLLRLQTHLFIQAARTWNLGGPPPASLLELGGAFATRARQAGWLSSGVDAVEAPLSTMFRVRWIKVMRLGGLAELEPSADDWRVYYGFLLRNPDAESWRGRLELQLSLVEALRQYDASYPSQYASGVLHYRLGDFRSAYEMFISHLSENPHGRFSLRARNGAVASAAQMLGG